MLPINETFVDTQIIATLTASMLPAICKHPQPIAARYDGYDFALSVTFHDDWEYHINLIGSMKFNNRDLIINKNESGTCCIGHRPIALIIPRHRIQPDCYVYDPVRTGTAHTVSYIIKRRTKSLHAHIRYVNKWNPEAIPSKLAQKIQSPCHTEEVTKLLRWTFVEDFISRDYSPKALLRFLDLTTMTAREYVLGCAPTPDQIIQWLLDERPGAWRTLPADVIRYCVKKHL
jgi:hypothetical protein